MFRGCFPDPSCRGKGTLSELGGQLANRALQVDDLARALEVKLAEMEQRADETDGELERGVGERLGGDDRLLASLGKLSGEFGVADREGDLEALRETCMK